MPFHCMIVKVLYVDKVILLNAWILGRQFISLEVITLSFLIAGLNVSSEILLSLINFDGEKEDFLFKDIYI